MHPFDVVDRLGATAGQLVGLVDGSVDEGRAFVISEAERAARTLNRTHSDKLRRFSREILVGFIVGGWFNANSGLCVSSGRLSEAV
jgi:hypothetical protein